MMAANRWLGALLGVALAKHVLALHGVNREGKPAPVRAAVRRDPLLRTVAQLPPCTTGKAQTVRPSAAGHLEHLPGWMRTAGHDRLDERIRLAVRAKPRSQPRMTIPGVGATTASALLAHIGHTKVVQTTALGAAYLAGLASGVYGSLDELSAQRQVERRFLPTLPRERAEGLMAGWERAVRQAATV